MQYEAIRQGIPDGLHITVLHVGERQTVVAAGTGAEPVAVLKLAAGSQKTAAEFFHHDPPTLGEMENAIVAVEDAIAGAQKIISDSSRLFTMDDAIRNIARISGVPDGAELILTRDAMERTFERLAAVILGRQNPREEIPSYLTFAATLLILREFMHHLQFLSITVKKGNRSDIAGAMQT